MPDATMPERVITWADVLPGDVIRGADGNEWMITTRHVQQGAPRMAVAMKQNAGYGQSELSGTPYARSVVSLLRGGLLRTAVETFTAAGLEPTVIEITVKNETGDAP